MGEIVIEGCWRSTASVEAVWDVLVDLETWPHWWPAISRARPVAPADGSVAATELTFDTRPPLRPLVTTLEVVEQQPPDRLEVTIGDGPLSGGGTFTIAEDPEGSVACYDVRLSVRSLLFRPLEPILRSATRSSGRQRLERAGADLARLAGGDPLEPPS